MRYDTVIIGAGMSGLAAGIRLARYGGKTLILERHTRPGGLNSFYTSGGYDMDVGLHAMTNYAPQGPKSAPIQRLLRQLRIPFDALKLIPQKFSRIAFPGVNLTFTNEFGHFAESVASTFPGQKDNFQKLVKAVTEYDDMNLGRTHVSGREVIGSIITDPLLVEMLLCPILYYGSAEEGDIDFGQFSILFKSIMMEGFARPEGGIKTILLLLQNAYMDAGGSIKMGCGASKIIVKDGKVSAVWTDDGDEIQCNEVISSAGILETMNLCPEATPEDGRKPRPGMLSFMESVNVLNCRAKDLGEDASIIFFNDSEKFVYENPKVPVDTCSGVICLPDNFEKMTDDYHMIRVTSIANGSYWINLPDADYAEIKKEWRARSLDGAWKFTKNMGEHIVFSDVFTPRTVRRFTEKVNGAVYGSPDKVTSGNTAIKGLYICGTDQGFLGITGAMLSGVTIANLRLMGRSS